MAGFFRSPLFSTLVILAVWVMLIDYLRLDWEINPQYSYGWLVPLFCAYVFWKRWASRPEPIVARSRLIPSLALALAALTLLPTRVVRESSPDWAVVRWAMALEVVGLTLASLWLMGGWPTVRHFAWPVCFFLVAVPWPSALETPLTQTLMQRVAMLSAEIVGWAGYVAKAQGNLIQLSTGLVGVDEACSGVRSLQSMLMASLLLGELYRFKIGARFALLGAGLLLALLFNLTRALTLVIIAIRAGLPTLEKWHDTAGFTILVLSFVALAAVVRLMRSHNVPEPAPTHVQGQLRLPLAFAVGLALWFGLTELATAAWYRSHESGEPLSAGWRVQFPEELSHFQNIPISETVRKTLAYNQGRNASWVQPDGTEWQMFFFQWAAGRTSTQSAREHRPEVCLPATGCALINQRDGVRIRFGDLEIPFRAYLFNLHGHPVHVFFCLWEVGNKDLENTALSQEWSAKSRLQRVLAGQRNLGQQSVEVVISGVETSAQAEAAFRRGLRIGN